jgi:hypothetical protein
MYYGLRKSVRVTVHFFLIAIIVTGIGKLVEIVGLFGRWGAARIATVIATVAAAISDSACLGAGLLPASPS